MGLELPIFICLSFLDATCIFAALALAYHLASESHRPQQARWILKWTSKGLLLPFGLWMLMNIGLSFYLQPFMPNIQFTRANGGNWVLEYLQYMSIGLFYISTFWGALTVGWALYNETRSMEPESRSDFKSLCWSSCVGMALPAFLLIFFGGWQLAGLAGLLMLTPIAGFGHKILHPKKQRPVYSRAVARMKFGKYEEAEWEIIRQLEKSEDDFEGWMMMAGLYANNFHDLGEAERTVLELCAQPKITASQISIALHKLADWNLTLGENPEGARRALEMISLRCPGTHLARMAQLRANQLPVSAEDLREQKSAVPIPLPALGDQLDEPMSVAEETDEHGAAERATRCVEKLKQNPDDVPAREKLARILAERLGHPDSGIEQLTLLLNMPEQPESKRAEWLGMIAAWHLRYRNDRDTARNILGRVINEFPQTPQALAAKRRLHLLDIELSR